MQIIRGKQKTALKVVVYGPEGIGKSTFAAQFPNPLFIDTEGGTKHMDVARTPKPTSWVMLLGLVKECIADPSLCGTLIPNVGKSTFINRILGRKSAKAADRPGVTRGSQWFRVDSGIDLLDTPGILWPKFDDERVGILLACTGAIKDDILDVETLGCKLMELLAEQAPQTIIDRYSIAIPEEECDFLGYELLQQAGRRRGFLLRGGEIDTERMARILLDEFRGGVLGRITLEKPE